MKKILTAIGITTLGFLMVASPAAASEEPSLSDKITSTSYVDSANILEAEPVKEQVKSVLIESGNQVLVYTSPTLDLSSAAETSGVKGSTMEEQAPEFFKSGVDAIIYVSLEPKQTNVYLKPEFKVDSSELTLIKTTLNNQAAEGNYTPAIQETIDSLGFVLLDQVDHEIIDQVAEDLDPSSSTIMMMIIVIVAITLPLVYLSSL